MCILGATRLPPSDLVRSVVASGVSGTLRVIITTSREVRADWRLCVESDATTCTSPIEPTLPLRSLVVERGTPFDDSFTKEQLFGPQLTHSLALLRGFVYPAQYKKRALPNPSPPISLPKPTGSDTAWRRDRLTHGYTRTTLRPAARREIRCALIPCRCPAPYQSPLSEALPEPRSSSGALIRHRN